MKTIFLFPKYPDDPTTVVQKADTSDKEIDTERKASPGSTTAMEKDDLMEGKGIVFFLFSCDL
jgi:hypothetical protein